MLCRVSGVRKQSGGEQVSTGRAFDGMYGGTGGLHGCRRVLRREGGAVDLDPLQACLLQAGVELAAWVVLRWSSVHAVQVMCGIRGQSRQERRNTEAWGPKLTKFERKQLKFEQIDVTSIDVLVNACCPYRCTVTVH